MGKLGHQTLVRMYVRIKRGNHTSDKGMECEGEFTYVIRTQLHQDNRNTPQLYTYACGMPCDAACCTVCTYVQEAHSYHPLRSANPLHSGSLRACLCISFFHSCPSDMTVYHFLQTSSAWHSDLASRNDNI